VGGAGDSAHEGGHGPRQGSAEARFTLALALVAAAKDAHEAPDWQVAAYLYAAAAEQGHARAQLAIGELAVGPGRKCSKCPSTYFKPSILESNSII
jgi:hypothetical protein